jgi:magnesium-transporting ATPase (P-type)
MDEARPLHSVPVDEVYASLGAHPSGLSAVEADARLHRAGPNAIRETGRRPLVLKFLGNFTHLMALLLWAGGIMAFIGRLPQLGWAIWAVIVINAGFSFWQEFKAERATAALKRLLPSYASVLREGEPRRILAEQLVPGDVMLLAEGDRISADGRLIEDTELRVDQSTLTGEAHPARKASAAVVGASPPRVELPNLVFAGTSVAAGSGKAVVFATGMETEFGKIAALTQSVAEELSPLQREVDRLTKVVTVMAVGIGVLFFALSVFVVHRPVSVGFIFAVGMVVAFVPEGLLPTVTLALAMGVQRMIKRHAFIKRLSSVETLGSTTVICTDKTGTLTQNEMTVRALWCAGRRLTVTGVGYDPAGSILDGAGESAAPVDDDLRRLFVIAGLCNNARLLPPDAQTGRWSVLGDPTEAALRVAALKTGLDLDAEARRTPRERELPFESRRKRMTTIHRSGAGLTAFVKGAPKEVLALCTHIRVSGEDQPLDASLESQIVAANDDFAASGLRVLAMADRRLPDGPVDHSPESVERALTFVGLMAMMDPPRPEVAEAVEKCHRAGIRIIMITGDYGLTAEAIALRIGIIGRTRPRIVTGADLDAMDDRELTEALGGEVIFARVTPAHKLRVVGRLQEMGHIVAVTGDGVNDAPALKKANIGVAMGLAGTDVAREAADMILTDDNFASIVNAVEEGRTVYANIRKFMTYIFTSNTPEAWPFILQIMFNIPLALTVMQLLAIDLGTDLVPALALGAEAPEPGIMDRPPRRITDRLIDRALLVRSLVWLGSIQTALCFAGFAYLYWTFGYRDVTSVPRADLLPYAQRLVTEAGVVYVLATTIFHAGVITTQIGNALACRTERTSVFSIGLLSNRFLLVGFLVEVTLILILIYVRPFQTIFEHGPLPPHFWALLALYAPVMLLAEEGRKAIARRLEDRRLGRAS